MKKQKALQPLDMKRIGDRIRDLILVQYDSLSSFAGDVGMTRQGLYQILSGNVMPRAQTLVDIARNLGCSMDFLLGVESPETEPGDGFRSALMNAYEYRAQWTTNQKLCLTGVALDKLTRDQEEKLRRRYMLP